MKNALKTALFAIVLAATVTACGTKSETTATTEDTVKVEAIDTTTVANDTTAAVVPADTTAVAK